METKQQLMSMEHSVRCWEVLTCMEIFTFKLTKGIIEGREMGRDGSMEWERRLIG